MITLQAGMPSTEAFIRKHYYALTERVLYDGTCVGGNFQYQKANVTVSLTDERVHMADILEAQETDWEPGCTEPWIIDVVASLVKAVHAKTVIEIGGFTGFASKRLARALNTLHGGTLLVCEIDPQRAERIQIDLDILRLPYVTHTVIADDSLRWLPTLADESVDVAWVDGDHSKEQVAKETQVLLSKMRPHGIIAYHDVFGICDLQEVVRAFGGFALDLPRLGPAGGLGLVQVS